MKLHVTDVNDEAYSKNLSFDIWEVQNVHKQKEITSKLL